MKKFLLGLIIILALGLRLYRIGYPLADWHSWRQADTSAVSRNFIKFGFDILHPRFDDLSKVASGQENPQGYRFVEFPIYNFIQAVAFKYFPVFNLEVWGRLISILCSLVSLFLVYLIAKKYLNTEVALLAAFFFAVLPFNIYYSRTILPESMLVMTSLAMIYFFDRLALFILFSSLSYLLKPYTMVFLLPVVYLTWQKWQSNKSKWSLAITIFISILPYILWQIWMKQYPAGIPRSAWLFNEGGIRLKGAWWYWLFAERIGKLILGYWGLILFGLGLAVKIGKKEGLLFYSWLAAIFAYFVIIAGGNVKHDYYQVIAIPLICIILAKGSYFLLTAPKEYLNRAISYSLFAVSCIFMLAFSWYQVRDYFNINSMSIIEAGKAVDKLLPKDAKVIAPYGGDTAFLYQTNRQGWPVGIEVEKMIKLGAQYYVNVNFDVEVDWLVATYCVIEKTPRWIIIDLTRKCPSKI